MKFESALLNLIQNVLKDIKPDIEINAGDINIASSENPIHGDFSTNCALKLSKLFSMPAMELGNKVASKITEKKPVFLDRAEVIAPGFINFFLSMKAFYEQIIELVEKKGKTAESNKKVLIEFLSANPTGPLTIAHGRHAVCGDTLANILEAAGYNVTREYYYNDSGRQMEILGRSLQVRYRQLLGERKRMFKDGYAGKYLQDIAKNLIEKHKKSYSKQKDIKVFTKFAENQILKGIREDLSIFRVKFDSWVKETRFTSSGEVKKVLGLLKEKGETYEKDGALWFKSTGYSDEKDRVLVRSNGEVTYIVPDLAYHAFKYKRDYDRMITILGPDHHGYVPRLMAGVKAMGLDHKKLTVKLLQLVSLYRGKKKLRMSTRSGEFVTLRQVMDEAGVDATRFFLCMRGMDAQLDFDLELARKESVENPVYYIQYAHSRICSVFGFAAEKNISIKNIREIDLNLINRREEAELIKKISMYPDVIEKSAEVLETHLLTGYLLELASLFHQYYNKYRFITDEDELTQARLLLAEAVRKVIFQGLSILGVKAPKKM